LVESLRWCRPLTIVGGVSLRRGGWMWTTWWERLLVRLLVLLLVLLLDLRASRERTTCLLLLL